MEIKELINKQKKFYSSNISKDLKFRIQNLKLLRSIIIKYEKEIQEALRLDLGKSETEAYMTEIGMVLDEIKYNIKHLAKWAKKKYVSTPLSQFPARSYRIPEPRGLVLIISPWNYPFLLSIQPLIGAIAAGNCVIIKPSEYSVNTSKLLKKILTEIYSEAYVTVVLGEKEVAQELLKEKFDYIFYTGSTKIGKIVMEAAAKNLTPVTLELGGKSPCIVDEKCNVELAAKRIAYGKILNSGQTCVAPDYVFVHQNVKEQFLNCLIKYLNNFLGENALNNSDYPKIINEMQFNRIISLIDKEHVIYGGGYNRNILKIEPTILTIKDMTSKVMQEEIFGPILPIIGYNNLDYIINYININPKPLALYLFTNNKKIEKRILKEVSYGGGCINDTIIHLANKRLGFGGVGNSGIGEYHGKFSFDTFSHYKSIIKKSNHIDLPVRYHPYSKMKEKLIRIFMK